MLKRINFSYKSLLVLSLLLSPWLCWFVAQAFVSTKPLSLQPVTSLIASCKTSAVNNTAIFKIKVPTEELAKLVIGPICKNEVINKQYGEVKVYWGGSLAKQIDFIGKGIADLTLSKESIVEALKAVATHNYLPIIGYPSYSAFIISNREKPVLDKAYFLDKKIGLLDYPTSRSGHIIPKQMFKKLDIDINDLDIVYVKSHAALREKLASGEVDLIASYWNQEDDARKFSENYISPIGSNITGSRWYLKMSDENTDLACAIQETTKQITQSQGSAYFEELKEYWHCHQAPYSFKGENK